jgi:AmmeMemoRadiSam system protein A
MNPYIELAKNAVEQYVAKKKVINVPIDSPKEMIRNRKGVFVTIEKKGELRGCVGTYLPIKENIAKEIIDNAIAASNDPRMHPVQINELQELSYTVYLLNEPQPVKDIIELDPKRYGLIIRAVGDGKQAKSALLLPDLEGVDTVDQQIAIVCQKGGIDPEKEMLTIFKFSVTKYQ